MLLRQHRGRREEGHLSSAHHRLERRADRHLRLAETHIAANKSVHRTRRFHVALGIGDGRQLIRCLVESERLLEFALPCVIGREGRARFHFALGLNSQEFFRIGQHRLLRLGPRPLPASVAQFAQRRIFPSDPHIARDLPALVERNIKFRSAREFERQNLTRLFLSCQHLESAETRDAVVEMNDKFVLAEIIEAQGLPRHGRASPAPSPAPLLETFRASENFRIGEQSEFGFGQSESAGQGTEHGRQIARRLAFARRQLAQTGGFALVCANDLHVPSVLQPSADLTEQIAPPLLDENNVTGGKVTRRVRAGRDFDFV